MDSFDAITNTVVQKSDIVLSGSGYSATLFAVTKTGTTYGEYFVDAGDRWFHIQSSNIALDPLTKIIATFRVIEKPSGEEGFVNS